MSPSRAVVRLEGRRARLLVDLMIWIDGEVLADFRERQKIHTNPARAVSIE